MRISPPRTWGNADPQALVVASQRDAVETSAAGGPAQSRPGLHLSRPAPKSNAFRWRSGGARDVREHGNAPTAPSISDSRSVGAVRRPRRLVRLPARRLERFQVDYLPEPLRAAATIALRETARATAVIAAGDGLDFDLEGERGERIPSRRYHGRRTCSSSSPLRLWTPICTEEAPICRRTLHLQSMRTPRSSSVVDPAPRASLEEKLLRSTNFLRLLFARAAGRRTVSSTRRTEHTCAERFLIDKTGRSSGPLVNDPGTRRDSS